MVQQCCWSSFLKSTSKSLLRYPRSVSSDNPEMSAFSMTNPFQHLQPDAWHQLPQWVNGKPLGQLGWKLAMSGVTVWRINLVFTWLYGVLCMLSTETTFSSIGCTLFLLTFLTERWRASDFVRRNKVFYEYDFNNDFRGPNFLYFTYKKQRLSSTFKQRHSWKYGWCANKWNDKLFRMDGSRFS